MRRHAPQKPLGDQALGVGEEAGLGLRDEASDLSDLPRDAGRASAPAQPLGLGAQRPYRRRAASAAMMV
ncbi:hypothetical protein EIB18_09530 [Caulobacter vibrioides]|uniref:Uncharacterized protein n=1 Tax=Caulobacter vibrioides (strain ATCC 19089 / CIP 103742 / CB 15) TaxID=190650 RepID=Q9A7D0_CAUVC|nr:hypothetical protein CC_1793 [Caulobacter vibrioides CB15]ATC28670.1 hypothetical protein CA607_09875 [Caulobacter vibrioides]AZH12925.1 hypothetical protein EIB18_09530 [Caulobacter vibrioides]